MSDVQGGLGSRLWVEQWAVDAVIKAQTIESRMEQALATAPPPDERAEATAAAIRKLLERSRHAAERGRWWREFKRSWRGTSVGEAHQSLHAAEVLLLDVLPDWEVESLVPHVTARALEVLDRDDVRLAALDRLPDLDMRTKRAYLQNTMGMVYESADQSYVRVRDFRNVLYIAAALITILMGGLVLLVSQQPELLPFCFAPGEVEVCPNGSPERGSVDVLLVAGLGLVGGAFAAAFSIRKIRGTSLPYDIPIALAMLKVPSGSLTAVVGMLLLGAGFVPGLSELDSQRQILAYAFLFGYAQQALTRLVDERAQRILAGVPSKPDPAVTETAPSMPRQRPPEPLPEQATARPATT